MSGAELTENVHVLLVTCVKTKGNQPAAAKDLYNSALFRKERAYAEHAGVPWFILSAEHDLVAPDEWLAPYERYLADTTASYRSAWGGWVAARLNLLAGPLSNKIIEIHAGSTYLEAIRPHLERLGARIVDPLNGLSMGRRLAWYGPIDQEPAEEPNGVHQFFRPFATTPRPSHLKRLPVEARPPLTDPACTAGGLIKPAHRI